MIDIVIPAHSGGPLLEAAIRSVTEQTSSDWRLYVVDDASPGTAIRDLVAGFEDSRVNFSRNDINIGVNAQFNQALTTGSADNLVIMGEDDEMLPSYVAQVNESLARFPAAAVVQPGVEVIDGTGRVVRPLGDRIKHRLAHKPKEPTTYRGEDLLASLLRGNWCYFPSLCWRRDMLGDLSFPEEFEVVQDLALLIEVLRRGHTLVVDPRPAFRYRRHADSVSSVMAVDGRRFIEESAYFNDVAGSLADSGMPAAAQAARWHLTSRLHAVVNLPAAIRCKDGAVVKTLMRHIAR